MKRYGWKDLDIEAFSTKIKQSTLTRWEFRKKLVEISKVDYKSKGWKLENIVFVMSLNAFKKMTISRYYTDGLIVADSNLKDNEIIVTHKTWEFSNKFIVDN